LGFRTHFLIDSSVALKYMLWHVDQLIQDPSKKSANSEESKNGMIYLHQHFHGARITG